MVRIVLRRDGFFDDRRPNSLYLAKMALRERLLNLRTQGEPIYENLVDAVRGINVLAPFVGNPIVEEDGSIYVGAKGQRYSVYYLGKIERLAV